MAEICETKSEKSERKDGYGFGFGVVDYSVDKGGGPQEFKSNVFK